MCLQSDKYSARRSFFFLLRDSSERFLISVRVCIRPFVLDFRSEAVERYEDSNEVAPESERNEATQESCEAEIFPSLEVVPSPPPTPRVCYFVQLLDDQSGSRGNPF